MRVVQWDESLLVGHEGIDAQHRKLFGQLDQLREAAQDKASESLRLTLLSDLIEGTQEHFGLEESVMNQLAQTDFTEHFAEHRRLMAQIRELQDKVIQGDLSLSLSVFQFLYGWLAHHIETQDRLIGCVWREHACKL